MARCEESTSPPRHLVWKLHEVANAAERTQLQAGDVQSRTLEERMQTMASSPRQLKNDPLKFANSDAVELPVAVDLPRISLALRFAGFQLMQGP